MIGIIDYGMGNLRSVQNALKKIGQESLISGDPEVLRNCDKLILPGVGAFGDCMGNLRERGLEGPVREMTAQGKPLLGICLGMQMLFEESYEKGYTKGFGFLKGKVIRMETDLPVPEIGWNLLEWNRETELKKELSERAFVYYVHSYYASGMEDEDLLSFSMYGEVKVPGIVGKGNVIGCQFHPEKSGKDGLAILKWFAEVFA